MAHGGPNDAWFKWLADDAAHPWKIWRLRILGTEEGRDDDDWEPCCSKAFLEPGNERDAVDTRHQQVHQDDARFGRASERVEARVAIVSHLDPVTIYLENALQECPEARLIVNHQDTSSQVEHDWSVAEC
jgi:hypothetical protein